MEVEIPGFVVPVSAARVSINGKAVFLRPRDRWPVFEAGAPELKNIDPALVGPLTIGVDYPAAAAKKPAAKKPDEEKAGPAGEQP